MTVPSTEEFRSQLVAWLDDNDLTPPDDQTLSGHMRQFARVQRARSLNDRAAALAEKARELVALDAQNAYHRWEEAARKLVPGRRAPNQYS